MPLYPGGSVSSFFPSRAASNQDCPAHKKSLTLFRAPFIFTNQTTQMKSSQHICEAMQPVICSHISLKPFAAQTHSGLSQFPDKQSREPECHRPAEHCWRSAQRTPGAVTPHSQLRVCSDLGSKPVHHLMESYQHISLKTARSEAK